MKDTESIEYFAGKLKEISSKSTSLGQTIEESKLVKKFLNSLPMSKYIQIAASLEQVLDLNTTSYEDIVGRLKAYEERIRHGEIYGGTQDNLLYANTEDCSDTSSSGGRGHGRGNRGRGRGRYNSQQRSTNQGDQNKSKEKKDLSKIICYRCDKSGHYASSCPERTQKIEEANKVETEEADHALYMHEIVFLKEENLIPRNYETKKGEEGVWYLDNGASNHMTGVKTFFSELNENITGKVKFGDGSCVDIGGKGSILFQGKTGEKMLLTDIYYIPEMRSNILSLGQATEYGCDVRMREDYLTLHDSSGRLLIRVKRSPNRLYKINLGFGKPTCLQSRKEEEEEEEHQEAKDSIDWTKACPYEIGLINKNKTWLFVDKLVGVNIIGLKWVFKIKRNADRSINKHKARLVFKVLGQATRCWNTNLDQILKGIEIKQEGYARRILQEADLETCNPTQVPTEFGLKMSKAQKGEEAEFMAATETAKKAIWLKELFKEIQSIEEKIILIINNKSAIVLTKNQVFHDKSKHIHKRYHFIRECIERELVDVEHVPGTEQKADILTKALARIKFVELRSFIGVQDMFKTKSKLKREIVG